MLFASLRKGDYLNKYIETGFFPTKRQKEQMRMKKAKKTFVLVTALVVFASAPAAAAPRDASQAGKVVRGWLKVDHNPLKTQLGNQVRQTDTFADDEGKPIYYVIYLQPAGFVIVPADDLVEPIIAFADNGTFDPSPDNPLGAMVSRDLPSRIAAARDFQALTGGSQQKTKLTGRQAALEKTCLKAKSKWAELNDYSDMVGALGVSSISDVWVAPLLQSKWSQSDECGNACYNYYTPGPDYPPIIPGDYNNYVCGCVATAMAQYMRYRQYPTAGVGTGCFTIYVDNHTYTACLRGGNGSGGAYSWDDMVLDPGCGITETQKQAIGALTYDAGVAAHMDYAYDGSGAYMHDARTAMVDTFMYSNAIMGGNEYSEIGATRNGMINPNLDSGNPVMLGIYSDSTGAGHAIVADGYGYDSATLYHHLNLGWAGSYDAWYNLPNMDTPYNFNVIDSCIYNIYISGSGEIISGRVTDSSGNPVSDANVTGVRTGGGTYYGTTDGNGIYALAQIPSSSTYTVSATKTDYTFTPTSRSVTTGISTNNGPSSGNVWGTDFTGPQPPVAEDGSASTTINTPVTITLAATDDGLPNPPGALTYIITSLPSNGELSDPGAGGITTVPYILAGDGNQVIYTPASGYTGTDNFTFKANDGGVPLDGGDSNQANVSISVMPPGPAVFLTEGFESDFVDGAPPGWTKAFKTDTVDWTRNVGDYRFTDSAHSGTYNAMLFRDERANHETYLITPVINFGTGTTDANVEFWHKQAKWLSDQDTLKVYYKTSAGGSWILLASYTANVSSWTKRTISLPNPGSTYYIGFLGNAKYGYGVCIDDVKVSGVVAAPPMRTLTISSTPGGHTEPNAGTHQYYDGTAVDINAVPDPNYHFVNWTGDTNTVADANAAVTTITMDANYAVQANFAVNQYTITASAGVNGSINPSGAVVVNHGGSQDFNALPDIGYEVDEWYLDSNSVQSGGVTYTLSNVTADHSVHVTFKLLTFTISGYVSEVDGSTAVEGVLIQADGNDVNSVTDSNGYYELSVDYGWSGTVEPNKTGYTFEPNSSTYTDVNQNYSDANYTATLMTYAISGYILEQDDITPIGDVNVSAENGGGQWTSRYGGGSDATDANGYYEVVVDYNWSGKVTPTKYAYGFTPENIDYNNVTADQNNQDYNGKLLTFIISGYIKNECDVPIAAVSMDANNGGGQDTTDTSGYYEVWVDYNWSGTVTPSKTLYTFDPNSISYANVLGDIADQNYVANNIYDLDCDGSIGFGDIRIISENWLDGPDLPGDFYKDEYDIVNFLDFAEFSENWLEDGG